MGQRANRKIVLQMSVFVIAHADIISALFRAQNCMETDWFYVLSLALAINTLI